MSKRTTVCELLLLISVLHEAAGEVLADMSLILDMPIEWASAKRLGAAIDAAQGAAEDGEALETQMSAEAKP